MGMLQAEIVALGFLVGGLIGLTGVGGGSIMTPLLILVFGIQPSIAVGTDLFYASVTKLIGAAKHWQQGTAEVRIAATLAVGSLPMALLGIWLAKYFKDIMGPAVQPIITGVLAWVLILIALTMLARLAVERWGKDRFGNGWVISPRTRTVLTIILGIVTGFLVSITSVGAGSIVMIVLVTLYRLPAKQLVGADILHAAVLAGVAAVGHFWAGNIDFSLAGLLLLGSIPGVLIGSRMTIRIPDAALRVSLALALAFTGSRLIVG